MERPPKYQPLSRDEQEALQSQLEEKDETAWNANDTNIIPANTRSFVLYLSIMLLSFSANILLIMENAKMRVAQNGVKTAFSGLTFSKSTAYHAMTDFWNPNVSENVMNAAWDSIDTNPIAVALDDKYVEVAGLPPTTRFPWDTERSVYYLKGIHDLHCLKLIRKAIVSKHKGENQTFSLHHIYHCLDGLRQDIMCMADDTPMPSPSDHHVGDGQIRQCRDWSQMIDWALEPKRNACYKWDDYREATNTLELFAHCPPDSPYYDFQQAYFEYHGHQDTYEVVESSEPTIAF
ncbi:hypothetical protein FB567DRAFT_554024 [Paraphoma chrysanthemicola]|uniref:Uncharacterized protein n=1 Tax=Paraphoma chrysanthemicola TaxID=798071 RepID=A0A8K0QUZ5_9PLEO|nr:hypothetical protein FB567DRAFT_554024 [Paraphoma chrysanthemicola]